MVSVESGVLHSGRFPGFVMKTRVFHKSLAVWKPNPDDFYCDLVLYLMKLFFFFFFFNLLHRISNVPHGPSAKFLVQNRKFTPDGVKDVSAFFHTSKCSILRRYNI